MYYIILYYLFSLIFYYIVKCWNFQKVLIMHSGSILISLGERLVNDEEAECRKSIAQCVTSMLQTLPKPDRDPLFEIVILWFKDKNVSIQWEKSFVLFYFVCYNVEVMNKVERGKRSFNNSMADLIKRKFNNKTKQYNEKKCLG